MIYIPSTVRLGRLYLALLDLISLATMAGLAWWASKTSGGSPMACWAAALGVLAIGATNNTMTQGQNGLVINGALALALATSGNAPTRARSALEGAALALAMTKPSSAILFLLAGVFRRRYLSVCICVVIVAVATWLAAWWLRIPVPLQFAQ